MSELTHEDRLCGVIRARDNEITEIRIEVASLQRELEEVKATRDNNAIFATTEKQWREQVESKLAASEAALRKFQVGFESSELAAKLLKQDLAASEAKCERMKVEVSKFNCSCSFISPKACLRCRLLAFLSELPSTSPS